jgi:FkbM family methyltransferase
VALDDGGEAMQAVDAMKRHGAFRLADEIIDHGVARADGGMRIRPLAAVLAEHNAPHVDFLKIDVEGAEADVLNGMNKEKLTVTVDNRKEVCGTEVCIFIPANYKIE